MFRCFALKSTGGLIFLLGACFLSATTVGVTAKEENSQFRVKDVDEWDVLYVRENPDTSAKIIGALPSDAREIRIIKKKNEAPDWRRIAYRDLKGWVNAAYIEPDTGDDRPGNLATRLNCLGIDPAWQLTLADGKAHFVPAGESEQLLYTRIPKMAVNRATTWAIEAEDAKTQQTAVFLIRSSGACTESRAVEELPYEMFGNFTNGVVVNGCCTPF